jgi:hypothetical protein
MHYSQGNSQTYIKSEICPVISQNHFLKGVQWHYRMEFEVNPLSKPSIYALYTQFCEILQYIGSHDKREFHVTRALRADIGFFYKTHLLHSRLQPIFIQSYSDPQLYILLMAKVLLSVHMYTL